MLDTFISRGVSLHIMKKLLLDVKKLQRLMSHNEINQAQLAKKVGVSRQAVGQLIDREAIRGAELFAPIFKLTPKDLIK